MCRISVLWTETEKRERETLEIKSNERQERKWELDLLFAFNLFESCKVSLSFSLSLEGITGKKSKPPTE